MSIHLAILSILDGRPATGYDIKKIMQDSPHMPWSGNNNQIYKALVELLDDGLVNNETVHQDGAPSKKIYTLTAEGINEIKYRVLKAPEPPEFKKAFLLQLASADRVTDGELCGLIEAYEGEIRSQLAYHEGKKQRAAPGGETSRDRRSALMEQVYDNLIASYACELEWTVRLREKLGLTN